MINEMNDRIASILMRGQIPVMEQEQPVQEAAPEQHTQQNYVESKVDIDAERAAQEAAANQDTREGADSRSTALHTVPSACLVLTIHVHAAAARSSRTATAETSNHQKG